MIKTFQKYNLSTIIFFSLELHSLLPAGIAYTRGGGTFSCWKAALI
jgi:hypothetical protein